MLKLVKLSHSSRLAFYKYYTFQTDKKDIGKAWFAPCYCWYFCLGKVCFV